jgi:hypothetical protein
VIDPFRMLISYHYFRSTDITELLDRDFPADPVPEVFADSGAFSALTQDAAVDVHEYAEWLKRYRHHFRVMANLDVIGDGEQSAEGTWANQRILEDQYDLPVLPVFHAAEPWSALDRLLEHGYRYIALGGLVGRPVKSIMAWLVRCFRHAEGQAVFHGFGLTSWTPMAELPWFSLDSSSWGSGYRYGMLRLYDDRTRRLTQIQVGRRRMDSRAHGRLVRELGFDPADLNGDKVDRALLCRISSVGWRRIEQKLRERHGTITIPGGDATTGVRMYAADGSGQNLADGAEGLRLYLADSARRDLAIAAHFNNEGAPS